MACFKWKVILPDKILAHLLNLFNICKSFAQLTDGDEIEDNSSPIVHKSNIFAGLLFFYELSKLSKTKVSREVSCPLTLPNPVQL